jgi:hypothetical protein
MVPFDGMRERTERPTHVLNQWLKGVKKMSMWRALPLGRQIGLTAMLFTCAMSPAVAQVPNLGPRPQGDVVFQAQQLPPANTGQNYTYSLCQGVNQAMPTNQECGGPFHPSNAVHGGNPPYHFQLDSGTGFPPFGIHLDKDGNLTGKLSKGAQGSSFRVCAVDLDATQSCQTMAIRVGPEAAAVEGDRVRIPIVPLAVAGGAGVAGAIVLKNAIGAGADQCGDPPLMPAAYDCVGINRNSAVCNAWKSDYTTWCSCTGKTFDVYSGSCR